MAKAKDRTRHWPGQTIAFAVMAVAISYAQAPNPPVIYLHYDYMVLDEPDGVSPAHSDAPNQESIDVVVNAFRRRGIQLIIDPQHTAIPHQQILAACGYGLPAFLRAQYFHPHGNQPWHYAVFAHGIEFCGPFPVSGIAELPGYDFMVGVGLFFHEPPHSFWRCGEDFSEDCVRAEAGTMMHELGHNLDLHHGGDQDDNFKPNYLSVMNYMFQTIGVPFAPAPGSTTIAGFRIDYSDFALPDLDENHLDEGVGLGGPSNARHIAAYFCFDDASCAYGKLIPETGPIDWNGDGVIESDVQFEVNFYQVPGSFPAQPDLSLLTGFDDWSHVRVFINAPPYVTGHLPPGRVVW